MKANRTKKECYTSKWNWNIRLAKGKMHNFVITFRISVICGIWTSKNQEQVHMTWS